MLPLSLENNIPNFIPKDPSPSEHKFLCGRVFAIGGEPSSKGWVDA